MKNWIAALTGGCAALLWGTVAYAHDASTVTLSPRKTYNFNTGWLTALGDRPGAQDVAYNDAGWQAVTLPNAFNEKEAFARDIKDLSTSVVWYRKRVVMPSIPAGGKAFLEFEGVRQAAEVWVNGVSVVLSENGAMAFGADITAALHRGENQVAVRVDNDWFYKERASGTPFQWNDRNFNVNFGGITKNVKLHLTGSVHQTLPLFGTLGTTGQYIWADRFDHNRRAATIHAESQVRNSGVRPRRLAFRVEISDREGKRISSFDGESVTLKPGETRVLSAASRLSGLNFWSWGYGYLYRVTTSLVEQGAVIDSVDTVTGFRSTRFADGMVSLNGRAVQIHGYAQRTTNEWPAIGASVPPWLSDFSNALMVQSGANLVRWMHIAPSRQDVDSSDRVGLMQSMPAGDQEADVQGRQWEQRKELMRDAIVYFRNSPSIVMYESGNRGISAEHMAEMKAIWSQFDPHGGRAIGARDMLDQRGAAFGGEMFYVNKSASIPMWAMEYSRDEGARAYQDNFSPPFHQDAPLYNRNQDSHAIENVVRWNEFYKNRPGTGRRVNAGGVNIVFSDSQSHFRGDNNYRRSGEVDGMRIPKEGFYAHQVMWSDWVDAITPATHIIGHWNYAPGTRKDINVVSNGESVELFLNGRSLGKGEKSNGFLFTWKGVAWEAGILSASAIHADKRGSQHQLQTSGVPVALKLRSITSPRGFVMDGADVALVEVEVVDAGGRRVPVANHKISFTLTGPAEWRGGIAQGDSSGKERSTTATKREEIEGTNAFPGTALDEDNFILAKSLPVENGVNRVILRAGFVPGTVRLVANAVGLPAAELEIPAVAAQAAKNGLSSEFPERALAGMLTRGPTPAQASSVLSRSTFLPSAVMAGSEHRTEVARNSIDDNESTRWSSDGSPDKAWIEYRFAQEHTFSQLELRLFENRSRSYPLRVDIDGKRVWTGRTEAELGYARIEFEPTKGSVVRVSQTGPIESRDLFNKVIEIRNDPAATKAGTPSNWRLILLEADFHGPVKD